MEINLEGSSAAVRDAASIVMLRDTAGRLEVFMLRRHGLSDVLGGAYVFPGGKVDRADHEPELSALLDAAPGALHAALGEPALDENTANAIYIAAIREAFEEAGVLYAQGATASDVVQAGELSREGRAFDEVLGLMRLKMAPAMLQPWSRWITPAIGGVMRKRFDTRFFVAAVPEGQEPRHDNHEATESFWLTPRAALLQYWGRQIELAPPQIMGLAHLARHASVASVIEEARRRCPPLIHPEPFDDEGVRAVCYPGDPRHPVHERALPGPTRLHYCGDRFEPAGGFEALFADA